MTLFSKWGHALLMATLLVGRAAAATVIQFFGQAGCSHCYAFLVGPLNQTLSVAGDVKSVSFEYFPWGNAYYTTSKCKGGGAYDILSRKCWDSNCGRDAPNNAPADCFGPGELICQNGQAECDADRYVACAKQVAGKAWQRYLPFTACVDEAFQSNPTEVQGVEALASRCAASTGLDTAALKACFSGHLGDEAIKAEAKATPSHGFCPVVFVNGQLLDPPDTPQRQFLTEVCNSIANDQGSEPPPKGCPLMIGGSSGTAGDTWA